MVKILSAAVATDGAITARVRVTDPKGAALDRTGVTTPGAVSLSLIAAYIPKGQTQYWAYTTRQATSPITGVSTAQAGTDSGGTFTQAADGEYTYTFKTRANAGYDRTTTHTIGVYAARDLTEFDMGTQYSDDVFNFVPNGSPVTVVRDVIRTSSCNKCHQTVGFHGGPRKSMALCNLCHSPQSIDPDTGNSVDMKVFIHKIHMGSSLPSVVAGKPYQIIGHNQTVADYSKVVFPADARNCTFCHEPKAVSGATQADNVYKPGSTACGSCHDNVNFDTGANHVNLPQRSDNQCADCHVKQGELEFDASIIGAHTIPRFSKTLQGVKLDVIAVDNADPGKAPLVTFTVKDNAGSPIPLKSMARLNLVLAGPTTDYSTYVSENALNSDGAGDGRYWYGFTAKIPADAKGAYSIGIEGRRDATLLPGTVKQQVIREVGVNQVFSFPVDGSKMQPRRAVVSLDKCNTCHAALSLHGDNRNTVEQCILCHSPNTVSTSKASVNFAVMVHRIHTGDQLERPYTIATTSFNEVVYPGDRRNCSACHVNGSENVPIAATLPTQEPGSPLNPMQPTTAACTGCHSSMAALSHALANTTKLGESCEACHGSSSNNSVANVHSVN